MTYLRHQNIIDFSKLRYIYGSNGNELSVPTSGLICLKECSKPIILLK